MLRKSVLLVISSLFLVLLYPRFSFSDVTGPLFFVPNYGETGWQTFSMTLNSDFSGTVGIGVSNALDTLLSSKVLVDNLQGFGPLGNQGFEKGDFTGYTVNGFGANVVTSSTSHGGTIYSPTEGSYMAELTASGANMSFLGVTYATDGTYITFPYTGSKGDAFSFDWNFLAEDYLPYTDFAFGFGQDTQGGDPHVIIGAQIGEAPAAVPEPATMLLLGSGLIGLAAYGKKRFFKK